MNRIDKLNVVLLALTGFGNTVLEALLADARVRVGAVLTARYEGAFPYYPEMQLLDLCQQKGVTCYHDVKVRSNGGIELLRKHAPDLIIVATFKQILPPNVLSLPALGVVNLHPSLLPKYRGPCPTQAALLNDEQLTGVTAHYVTENLDEGDILLQRRVAIGTTDNDGRLRQKLAKLAGEMIPDLLEQFADFGRPAGAPQDHALASLAPRPTVAEGYLELAGDVETVRRKVRAFNPFPGTSIRVGERRVAVDRFELCQDSRGDGLYESSSSIDLVMDYQGIRLYKKADSEGSA